ncbi:MAG: transcriptional regulator [Blastopirellula sp.]|nr:MAG: transcriptional regulator [Blastopirellula sp.]
MAGHKKFSTLLDKMTPERRIRSDERVKQLPQEMLLSELRKHSGKTQKEIAALLGISQPSLSQMESQADMQISTLNRLVDSLGGSLEVIVHMPDGDVRLTQFD